MLLSRSIPSLAVTLATLLALVLCAPSAALSAPKGAGADDEAPPAESLDPGQTLDAGFAYLRARVDGEPAALGFAYMLHRRFGLLDFGDSPALYDAVLAAEPTKGSAPKGALRLFRRMVDADQKFEESDIADLGTPWDRVTVRALYCDQAPLPDDYGATLAAEASRGGYHLTHVGMALTWLSDNECPWPVDDATVREWIDAMAQLVAETPTGDISYEAAGVLSYLGHDDRIPREFWDRVVDEQNEDGGWPFDAKRPESHWHPTLLATWALLEHFAIVKLDRTVPQADGPEPALAPPPASVPQANETVPSSWTEMMASEERLLALTPHLGLLASALRNLELPGDRARPVFEPAVAVVDVEAKTSPTPVRAGLSSKTSAFVPGKRQTRDRAELALWKPLLDQVAWFDHAAFHMVRGDFLPGDDGAFQAEVSLDARAKLQDGTTAWVRGKLTLVWESSDEEEWRIAGFRTDALEIEETPRPFFREVLSDALRDDDLLRDARHSGHDEVVRSFLGQADRKGHDFFPPAMDEHPGLAIVDLDRDGFDDIYVMPHWGQNQMYRNRGDGSFEEIGTQVGLDIAGHTAAAVFADFDNDGDLDAMLARTQEPSLYLRNDDGRFHDAAVDIDGGLPKLASSVTAVDMNGDGLLDVYFATYAVRRLTRDFFSKKSTKDTPLLDGFVTPAASTELRRRLEASAQVYDFPGPPNVALLNTGNGHFVVEPRSPLGVFANTYQATWADYDADGDPDAYLANDFAPNHLLRNDGKGQFADVTTASGTSDVGFGMGATWGDIDGDAREDLYVSNMFSKAGRRITARFGEIDDRAPKMARGNTLFRNEAPRFRDLSEEPGDQHAQKAGWSWGGQFADVDNDASLDLYVLSGYYTAPREFELPIDT